MGVIWQDNRTPEQKSEAEAATIQRRAEWKDWHAANPTRSVVDMAGEILQSLPRPSFSDALDAVWSCPTCGATTDRDPDEPSYVVCTAGHRFKTPIRTT